MANFLEETTSELEYNGKTWKDVRFIRTSDEQVKDIEKFKKSMDFEYDDGYGSAEIPEDLIVVGDNWWLERHGYDGKEWWEYKELPTPIENTGNYVLKKKSWIGNYSIPYDEYIIELED